jgi:hypothetical protein
VTAARRGPLISALIDPAATVALSAHDWNDVLILAREHALLPRLAAQLAAAGLFETAPKKARSHMRAGSISAESTHTAIRFELNRVLRALADVDAPVVLLKGAAYVMANLPPARGRFVGDLDFMVPRDRIDEVEEVLIREGWAAAEMDEYDQRYYREWAHEIPPLQHPDRETPLDVHHTIVPLTSRAHPDAAALFAASVPLDDSRLRVLSPADMVLHSTVHLFNDDVGKPLRDLLDLDDLLLHFGSRPGFWDDLVARARLHGLGRPLYHMLRQRQRVLGRGVPPEVEKAAAAWAPGPVLNFVMDRLFASRFACDPSDEPRTGAGFANWLLYVRSHLLRMPLPLLVRHLSVKAVRRVRDRFERKPDDEWDV